MVLVIPMRVLALAFLTVLAACASAQNDDPEPGAGAGGSSSSAGGSGGSGGGGTGASGGKAGSGNAGGGPGGAGGAGKGAAGTEGPGGSDGGDAGDGGDGGTSGAAGTGGKAGGSGAAGKGSAGVSGGSGQSGVSGQGGATGGVGGAAGSPFGGGPLPKTCAKGGAGGAGSAGGGKGIAGGYCAADSLGNPNDDPCYTCWNGSRTGACQQRFADCEGSADCVAFFACWSTCNKDEDACTTKCNAAVPGGAEAFSLVRDCVYLTACPQECVDQCNGIGSANRCNHTVCTTGYDLDPDCSPCAAKVCAQDQVCCDIGWEGTCRAKAEKVCGLDCSEPLPGCVHSECATGAPLDAACSPCATKVCQANPLCCQPFGKWDLACAEAADALCTP